MLYMTWLGKRFCCWNQPHLVRDCALGKCNDYYGKPEWKRKCNDYYGKPE